MEEALEKIRFNLPDVYDDDERILQALLQGVRLSFEEDAAGEIAREFYKKRLRARMSAE